MKKKKAKKADGSSHKNKPISLAPLDFETAVGGLLAIDPKKTKKPTAPKKKKPAKKHKK